MTQRAESTARRCAVYVRISVSNEESGAIARQVEVAERYAAARGRQASRSSPTTA